MNEGSSYGADSSLINNIMNTSRILWKHDLEVEEICCANDIFLSKKTPRLRAETTGKSMTLLSRLMLGLLSSESCYGRPKTRNSVLEGLRDRKLEGQDMSSWIRYSYSVFKVSDVMREI